MRVIVVGSGIVGASCAYAASSLGAEVVLVDAALPGRATAAGAGIICPWSSQVADPAWRALAYAAAREYPALTAGLADAGETDVSYRQVGALVLAAQAEDRERIRLALLARRAAAPEIGEVAELSGAEAQRLFPPLRADAAAVYIGGAARVDGRQLAAALTRAAVRQGAVARDGEARLAAGGGRVGGVYLGAELIEGDAVIAATGAWTRPFLREAGLEVPVEAQRGQIMHISMDGADTSRWPVVLPGASGHYLLAFDGGRVVAGATREAAPAWTTGSPRLAWPRSSARPWPSPRAWPAAPTWKPGSDSARWDPASGRCSARCPVLTAWSSRPAWALRG